jgi:hypothetical protein
LVGGEKQIGQVYAERGSGREVEVEVEANESVADTKEVEAAVDDVEDGGIKKD